MDDKEKYYSGITVIPHKIHVIVAKIFLPEINKVHWHFFAISSLALIHQDGSKCNGTYISKTEYTNANFERNLKRKFLKSNMIVPESIITFTYLFETTVNNATGLN